MKIIPFFKAVFNIRMRVEKHCFCRKTPILAIIYRNRCSDGRKCSFCIREKNDTFIIYLCIFFIIKEKRV